ncbi:helix-turn-helix domain-containing protein [Gottschalkia acidurici]|uniref:helix-turn-helix domain-containing protein n=1 Tax=Clostridium acidurici TaxID=1556 RepID=UPI003B83A480
MQQKLTEYNLKQKDLCNLTNLSKNAISNYISGNRVPDTNSIYKISIALNVSIEWLLTGEETLRTPNNSLGNLSVEEIRIITLFRKLNSIERNKIEGMLEIKVFESKQEKKTTLSNC